VTSLSDDRLLAEVTDSTATLAALTAGADLTRQVPTCPEWTLRQLITHVGRAHRWAAENITTRASEPVPFRQVPGGRLPDDPGEHAAWLTDGAARLASAVRAAGPEPLWTPVGKLPVSAWARRIAHETAVHRADGQITMGQEPVIDPDIARDGIDEWLMIVSNPDGSFSTTRTSVLAGGRVLHLHATDGGTDSSGPDSSGPDSSGTGPGGEWLVSEGGSGLTVTPGHGKGDVAVRGPAWALLLLLVRRLPPDSPRVEVIGDRGLLDAWLAATPF
jgi:uncharacterized protein (TIGR03083 family)